MKDGSSFTQIKPVNSKSNIKVNHTAILKLMLLQSLTNPEKIHINCSYSCTRGTNKEQSYLVNSW